MFTNLSFFFFFFFAFLIIFFLFVTGPPALRGGSASDSVWSKSTTQHHVTTYAQVLPSNTAYRSFIFWPPIQTVVVLLLLFSSGAQSRIICNRLRWGQRPSDNWVLLWVRWTKRWWDHPHRNSGCVHFPIPDIQSLIKCTSVSFAWPHRWHVASSGWSWFVIILLRYHANSGVCPPVWRRVSFRA